MSSSLLQERPKEILDSIGFDKGQYVSELKRIQSFPDDFVLHGSYSQQVERIGNSVPPVMMMHIARKIKDEILDKIKDTQNERT